MAVDPSKLSGLHKIIPYMWRVQNQNEFNATCVAYIDARDVQNILDEVVGPENWSCEYHTLTTGVGIQTFAKVGICIDRGNGTSEWVYKSDTGSESNTEENKGLISDSFKRSCVHWGIGRFLYNLGIQKIKTKKHTNNKLYPCDNNGNILWDGEALTDFINNKTKTNSSEEKIKYAEKKETVAPSYSTGSWSSETINKIKNIKKGDLIGKDVLKTLIPIYNEKYNTNFKNVVDFNNDELMNQLIAINE